MKTRWFYFIGAMLCSPVWALDLPQAARLNDETLTESGRYAVPIGPFDGAQVPRVDLAGRVKRRAWEIPRSSGRPMRLLRQLRKDLEENGFDVVLDCNARQCGGFDFRFGIEVLPAPAIYVNLRDFHFVSLIKGPQSAPSAAVTLLLSVSRDRTFLQIIEVTRDGTFDTAIQTNPTVPDTDVPETAPVQPIGPQDFLTTGTLILGGVDFASGATRLGAGPFPQLDVLAQFLKDNPTLQIALVGHTDSVGSLNGNIRVSRARAQAVKDRLVKDYGADASRIEAQGAGYLSPVASNLTEDGRSANRRVEAVILRAQ